MIYALLAFEFMKIGLFSIGGGLATLPFLYEISDARGWFSRTDVANMIAIGEATPGPIGVNMATYAGFQTAGLPGSLAATLSMMVPGIIISSIVYKYFTQFRHSRAVEASLYGVRPVVTALICMAMVEVLRTSVIPPGAPVNLHAAVIFAGFVFLVRWLKWNPIAYIGIAGAIGVIAGQLPINN
jgi:chromate transporter